MAEQAEGMGTKTAGVKDRAAKPKGSQQQEETLTQAVEQLIETAEANAKNAAANQATSSTADYPSLQEASAAAKRSPSRSSPPKANEKGTKTRALGTPGKHQPEQKKQRQVDGKADEEDADMADRDDKAEEANNETKGNVRTNLVKEFTTKKKWNKGQMSRQMEAT